MIWDGKDRAVSWITAALFGVIAGLCALFCGCRSYTVVAADREVVPVAPLENGERKTENGRPDGRRTYVEAEEGATGWYVPDAVLLDLLNVD